MKLLAITAAILALSGTARAEDKPAPPTVALTQDQLTRLLQAEQARAVANFAAQAEAAKAKDAYEAINAAFAPKAK